MIGLSLYGGPLGTVARDTRAIDTAYQALHKRAAALAFDPKPHVGTPTLHHIDGQLCGECLNALEHCICERCRDCGKLLIWCRCSGGDA